MIQIEGFNVRIVAKGEGYGRNDALTHDHDDPLVEFYDARKLHALSGPRGQFVSRYYHTTLLASDHPHGLQLDGGVPEWSISTKGMRDVKRYLRGYLQEAA